MGQEAFIDKTELSPSVSQESNTRCTSALGHNERSFVRALFQASSDEFLRGGDISLLQRIDRLDNILSAMEDKASLEPSGESFRSSHGSRRVSWTPASLEKRCKSTESVLEEVEEKGTIVERVSELEKRLTKLQRMLVTKSGDSATYPDLVEVTSSHHSLPSHDEREESSQDDIDVEKHEVTSATSAPLEPSEYERQHEPPFVYSEKHDISPRKEGSSPHMEGQQGRVSSEGASMEQVDPKARRQQSKKNGRRIKKWLSKQLHFGSSTRQGKHICSTGHCWSYSHKNSKSCWNMKRGGLHAGSDYTHFAHNSIDEDSP